MRHAEAELALWLANDERERRNREAALMELLPTRPAASSALRQRAGEILIETGRRLLPAPERARYRTV